ncbi:MAG: membrane protein insertase YidC [Sandaracinus sp.]
MDGNEPQGRSSLSTIMLAATAFILVYYGAQYFFGGETPEAGDTTAETTEELSPEEQARAAEAAAERARLREERRATGTITTDEFVATIDNLAGGVSSFVLRGDRFHDAEGHPQDLVTTTRDEYRPLRIALPGAPIPDDAVWDLRQVSEREVELRWRGQGLEVVRSISAGTGPYQLWQTVVVRNVGSEPRRTPLSLSVYHYIQVANEGGGMFGGRSPNISQGICSTAGSVVRKDHEALQNPHGYGETVEFAGVENVYFVQALAPSNGEPAARCALSAAHFYAEGSSDVDGNLFTSTLRYATVDLPVGGEHSWTTLAYMGPKDWHALERAGHHLPDVVNLGTFAVIARGFATALGWIYGRVGNWGIAIIILTMIVKILLFPVVNRQFRAMAPMRKLKPEMDRINEELKDDMEARQRAILALYQKHGVNPAAQMLGCLPVFLQMPVFFALYTSLSTNIELYHQPFVFFWTDLSARDPYFVLPVMLSGLMFVQQKLMPNTGMDPNQARIMLYMMPIMMGAFMLFLPSGLCLYMLTNSGLSIAQQQFNFWRVSQEEAAREAANKASSPETENTATGTVEKNDGKSAARTSPKGSGRSRRG